MREAKKESSGKDQRMLATSATCLGLLDFLERIGSSFFAIVFFIAVTNFWMCGSWPYLDITKVDLYLATLETIGGVL